MAQLCATFGVLEELGKETELSEAADSLYPILGIEAVQVRSRALALESRYPGILVPRQLACPQAVFDYESGKKIFLGLQDCRQACF